MDGVMEADRVMHAAGRTAWARGWRMLWVEDAVC